MTVPKSMVRLFWSAGELNNALERSRTAAVMVMTSFPSAEPSPAPPEVRSVLSIVTVPDWPPAVAVESRATGMERVNVPPMNACPVPADEHTAAPAAVTL